MGTSYAKTKRIGKTGETIGYEVAGRRGSLKKKKHGEKKKKTRGIAERQPPF